MSLAVEERPVFFGDRGSRFGILTTGARSGRTGAVICLTPEMGDSPVGSKLARHLAESGIPAIRFDLPGHGEHSGPRDDSALVSGDIYFEAFGCMAAVEFPVMIGAGLAARGALAAAARAADLGGVVLTRLAIEDRVRRAAHTMGLADYVRRARSASALKALSDPERRRRARDVARARLSARFSRPKTAADPRRSTNSDTVAFDWEKLADPVGLAQLHDLIARRVPMLMVSGAEDNDTMRMRRLLAGRIPDVELGTLEMASVRARTLKGFRSVPAQDQFVDLVVQWVQGHAYRS